MSENQPPNTPESKSHSKGRSIEAMEAKVEKQKKQIAALEGQKEKINAYMEKTSSDIVEIQRKIDVENTKQIERISTLREEFQKRLESVQETNQRRIAAAQAGEALPAEDLKPTKEAVNEMKKTIDSIRSEYLQQLQEFKNEFKNSCSLAKTTASNVFARPTNVDQENSELKSKISAAAHEVSMQMNGTNENGEMQICNAAPSLEREKEEKKCVECGVDAADVPSVTIRLSNYTAKWMLENAEFLSRK